MKKILFSLLLTACTMIATAQLTTLPDGGNKKAMVGEKIGITDVMISYSRPHVKGREGKIWGQLIYTGFADQGFGTSKAAPWRAGANENTTIEFSTDVSIEGKPLPAGKYALFVAYDPNESTVIFSKNSTSWGSFFYNDKEDALRVKVKPVALDSTVEWLKYEFTDQQVNSATVALQWEKLKIPFTITVDYVNTQLESFRRELRSDKGFTWVSWNQAAAFTAQNNIDLEEGLTWADRAISEPFVGDSNFVTLSTKSMILSRLNRQAEADAMMKKALPLGNTQQLHNYGRQLISQKKTKEALEVFKLNYDRSPNTFVTNAGMLRGYSGVGNYKKALEFAQKALVQAPDEGNKSNIQRMIVMLKEGKDIN